MKDVRYIFNSNGQPQSGYTIKLYIYYNVSPYYQGDPIVTYTDNGDGSYYADIDSTVKGTLVVTDPSGNVTIPTSFIGYLFWGDDAVNISPEQADGDALATGTDNQFNPE